MSWLFPLRTEAERGFCHKNGCKVSDFLTHGQKNRRFFLIHPSLSLKIEKNPTSKNKKITK